MLNDKFIEFNRQSVRWEPVICVRQ